MKNHINHFFSHADKLLFFSITVFCHNRPPIKCLSKVYFIISHDIYKYPQIFLKAFKALNFFSIKTKTCSFYHLCQSMQLTLIQIGEHTNHYLQQLSIMTNKYTEEE